MKKIHWAGDYLLDEYLHGHLQGARFVTERREVLPGGALLAGATLSKICNSIGVQARPIHKPDLMLRLTRYVQDGQVLLETYNHDWPLGTEPPICKDNFYKQVQPGVYSVENYMPADALLLSFYKKGMAQVIRAKPPECPYRIVVVDTRYREFWPKWINSDSTSQFIWHCTGQEFDRDMAVQYDWVVHTNGPESIQVGHFGGGEYRIDATIEVQPIEGRSTCGAGDIFSAALCAFLSAGTTGAIVADDIIRATTLAAQYVQERIQQSETLTISP